MHVLAQSYSLANHQNLIYLYSVNSKPSIFPCACILYFFPHTQHSFQFKKLKLSVLKDQLLIDDLVIEVRV